MYKVDSFNFFPYSIGNMTNLATNGSNLDALTQAYTGIQGIQPFAGKSIYCISYSDWFHITYNASLINRLMYTFILFQVK